MRARLCVWWLLWCSGVFRAAAAEDPRPVVGPGASKEAVIDAYGWPNGQAKSGTKEILNYPQGQVTLENGKVERVDFNMNIPWPAPRPRPGPAATVVPKPETAAEFWLGDFDEALRQAARRNARVLALFTGSDWSPASKTFVEEVAFQPEFVSAFMGDFVFVRLDFPTRAPMAADVRERNARLRERYGVTTYPALLIISPTGALVTTVDLAKPPAGETYRARAIAAVREARDRIGAMPPAAQPPGPATLATPATAGSTPTASAAPAGDNRRATAVASGLQSARGLIAGAVAAGLALAALGLWFVWRKRGQPQPAVRKDLSARIADAGSGLPRAADMALWPRTKLRGLAAGLAESEGFTVEVLAANDVDLKLRRSGEATPRVLVFCVDGQTRPGPVSIKRVRELFGAMTLEGVATGWLVAPAGFAPDAREFAERNGIVAFDGERLLSQLRDLPPLLLPKVLSRVV